MLADNESLKLFIGAGVDFAVTRSLLVNSRGVVKRFVQALSEAIELARRDRAAVDRIYRRYLNVTDAALLDFMYRTYVQGAIPQRPNPKLDNVALGIEEFAAKPGLKGKNAEDLTDQSFIDELEREGFFKEPVSYSARAQPVICQSWCFPSTVAASDSPQEINPASLFLQLSVRGVKKGCSWSHSSDG